MFNNQYKQHKKIRLDIQKNKQVLVKDQTQSLQRFLEKAGNNGLVEIPYRTYKHEGKVKQSDRQHGTEFQKGPAE